MTTGRFWHAGSSEAGPALVSQKHRSCTLLLVSGEMPELLRPVGIDPADCRAEACEELVPVLHGRPEPGARSPRHAGSASSLAFVSHTPCTDISVPSDVFTSRAVQDRCVGGQMQTCAETALSNNVMTASHMRCMTLTARVNHPQE